MNNVLIVEPNKVLAKTYAKSLDLIGIKSYIASGAQEAIDCADNNTPNIVLLELQLAEHSGLEFLYEFRSHTDWRHVPIIINTNIPSQRITQNKQQLDRLGIRKVLYKPQASLNDITREIRALI